MNEKSNPIVIWYNELTRNDSYLFFLFLTNLIIRIFHHLIYSEVSYTDTESYLELTNCLLAMDFSNYQAIRTPIYPLVLFLHHIDTNLVWVAQSLMGISNSILLYLIAKNITKNKIAFIIAISYSLSFNILFAEAALLSETTSIFFLLLTIYVFTKFIKENKINYLIQIGLFSSLAVLTRPIMIILLLAILLSIYLFYKNEIHKKKIIYFRVLYFLVPVLILLLGFSLFNYFQVNYFSITTLTGFNLSNHSGGFIEKCQDLEYQQIKDILIEYREKRGTHLWGAIEAQEELMQKTGLSYSELSQKLTMMSLKLFLQEPDMYLKSVSKSYINFWGAGNLWQPENIKQNYIKSSIEYIWIVQKYLLIILNLFFIISIILFFVNKKSIIIIQNPLLLLMVMIIIFSSIFQALVEHGENTRYKLPFQPLILIVVIKIIYDTLQNKLIHKTSIVKSYFKVLKEL